MTIRTLFIVILKVLGIFFIKDILSALLQVFTMFQYMGNSGNNDGLFPSLMLSVIVLLVNILVTYYLLFKTEVVVDKLNLDKGFDEDTIQFNTHRSTVISIAIMLTAIFLLANEVPNLLRQLYYLDKGQPNNPNVISYAVLAAAKIIVALLMLGFHRPIVNMIELARPKRL